MSDKKTLELRRSDFAENFLYLDGSSFSLDDYPHMRAIYNESAKNIVLKFSRQTAKSTTLANIMVANSALIPHFRTLYVAPTVDQTKVFSRDRVSPVLETSPLMKQHYINSAMPQNVFMKQLLNYSKMYLRYALLSADHLRGYCQTESAEYNTLRGWLPVNRLTTDDYVLTKNEETGELQYQKPTDIIIDDYDGPIQIYKTRGKPILEVTPKHRIHASILKQKHVGAPYGSKWTTDNRSYQMQDKNFRMGIGEQDEIFFKDASPKYFELPGLKTNIKANGLPYANGKIREFPSIKLPIKEFMIFMG